MKSIDQEICRGFLAEVRGHYEIVIFITFVKQVIIMIRSKAENICTVINVTGSHGNTCTVISHGNTCTSNNYDMLQGCKYMYRCQVIIHVEVLGNHGNTCTVHMKPSSKYVMLVDGKAIV